MCPGGKDDVYAEVCSRASFLFARIREVVACRATPTTLKAAFLDPIPYGLTTEVNLDIFARTDNEFMTMFNGMPDS